MKYYLIFLLFIILFVLYQMQSINKTDEKFDVCSSDYNPMEKGDCVCDLTKEVYSYQFSNGKITCCGCKDKVDLVQK